MIITANAYYQEEDNGLVKNRLRASVHVDSESLNGDDSGRSLARNLFYNMMASMPKGGEKICG